MLAKVEPSRPRGGAAKTRPGGAPPRLPGRTPPHPGQFLESRFLRPLGLSQTELAAALGVSRRRVNELVVGRRGVTPDTAVRLAAYFRTEPEFWLQMQAAWDVHRAMRNLKARRN